MQVQQSLTRLEARVHRWYGPGGAVDAGWQWLDIIVDGMRGGKPFPRDS
ncbi:MAG: hypothetical protein OXF62_02140 [Caldilineaceae bacterium]|nr:hypothetical protein [Caldilineaceae bacterium]MCY4089590.1 hypothetical protein [Caldilineaceae bacterium]MCY4118872.1 hypothetical protein [Caldilineaceae bacterium]MDE0070794.1 hypothetical protein [Caldilineaceae bacterium]